MCFRGLCPGKKGGKITITKSQTEPSRTKRRDTKASEGKRFLFVVDRLDCLDYVQPLICFLFLCLPYMATHNFTGYFQTTGWGDSGSARMQRKQARAAWVMDKVTHKHSGRAWSTWWSPCSSSKVYGKACYQVLRVSDC